MGFLTERERVILQMLSKGNKVSDIAKELNVSITSVSRSISRIRMKCMELEDDVKFLNDIGFIRLIKDGLIFPSRDPKTLQKSSIGKR